MNEILHIINEMSPYLLLGFFVAGLMHVFIPKDLFTKFLSKQNFASVIYATLLGIPLPLCSCGVIPTAMSLRREGASKGATTAFLVATPQTGIDSIFATFSVMGLPFAIIRPIAALVTALFSGQMVNWLDKDKAGEVNIKQCQAVKEQCESDDDCCCHGPNAQTFVGKMKEALKYAFIDMLSDIGRWLAVGIAVASLITILVPDSFFQIFAESSFMSILLVLFLAIPMYLCATGSIPIAVALMLKGLTPGAGLVLLMAGPASNIASILVIRKVLGNKSQLIYLLSIIIGSVTFALIIDHVLPREWFTSHLIMQKVCCHEASSWFSQLCTDVLAILLLYNLYIRRFFHRKHQSKTNTIMENEMIFTVQGMNCNHCRMNAEKALQAVEGVESATVDLDSKQARVIGTATFEALSKALDEIGFTAEK